MICLGFTSSTDRGSIAISYKNKIIKLASWTRKEQASEALTLKIKSGLKKLKLSFKDLTLIAVDKGPGSFTGSRIAVNVAKTLAYSLKIPIAPMTSLDVLAFGFSKTMKNKAPSTVFTLLDAHKSLFYFQEYGMGTGLTLNLEKKIQALSLDQISQRAPSHGTLFLIGNLSPKVFAELKKQIQDQQPDLKIKIPTNANAHFPQATSLVEIVIHSGGSHNSKWQEVEPSYIRSPDAVEKLKII
jgi:tRNA threonylcarbamoyladenosine biosynthesis protein TsaB